MIFFLTYSELCQVPFCVYWNDRTGSSLLWRHGKLYRFFLMINKVIALNIIFLETKSSYSLVLYQTPTISVQIRGNTCQYQLLTIKLRKFQVPKFGYLRSGNHGKIPEYIVLHMEGGQERQWCSLASQDHIFPFIFGALVWRGPGTFQL